MKATTKELVNVSDGEKQRIVMQISAVQTDMQANLDKRRVTSSWFVKYRRDMPTICLTAYIFSFRDIQIRKNVVARLEECETKLTEETKERQSGEKEVRAKLESQSQTLQSYMDNTADVIRKLTEVCGSNNVPLFL